MLESLLVNNSNKERFNFGPLAGAIKVTGSRGITLQNSLVADTYGLGFWVDESCYDMKAINNVLRNNAADSIAYELSQKGIITGNTITGSGSFGVHIFNTGDVQVTNNDITGNGEVFDLQQDSRTPTASTPPDIPWKTRDIAVNHNTFRSGPRATAIVRIDAAGQIDLHRAAEQNIWFNYNTYTWSAGAKPRLMWFWSKSSTTFSEYTNLYDLSRDTNQEWQGRVVAP